MDVRRALETDRSMLAEFAARLQVRPERHVGYLGVDAATIAAEMIAEDDDWTAASVIASAGGLVLGWLMGSVDVDMGRVWWYGPFVEDDAEGAGWATTVDALFAAARALLPVVVVEEEIAVDGRFGLIADWAASGGFGRDPGSSVLVLDGTLDPPRLAVRSMVPSDAPTVGVLHDDLFPGTHTTGAALVASGGDRRVHLVAERDRAVLGYVAVERQPDGFGYIDYLGVAPEHRRQGFGADLVRAGVAALAGQGCRRFALTVREDNPGARALYLGLGFVEERVIVPFRRGFSIP